MVGPVIVGNDGGRATIIENLEVMPDEIAEPMDDNEALRRILAEFQELKSILAGEYDEIDMVGPTLVDDSPGLERAADSTAVKTVVTNDGPDRAYVYEDNNLVAFVGNNGDEQLPLTGKGAIKVVTQSGDTALVTITTFRKTT